MPARPIRSIHGRRSRGSSGGPPGAGVGGSGHRVVSVGGCGEGRPCGDRGPPPSLAAAVGRAGTIGAGPGYERWGVPHRTLRYTLAPARGGRSPSVRNHQRKHDARDPHRIVLRALRHSLHLPVDRAQGRAAGEDEGAVARTQELRPQRRHVPRRGPRRRPQHRRSRAVGRAARRVPQDLQLLHVVPPVHVRELLERPRGPLPLVRPEPERRPSCPRRCPPSTRSPGMAGLGGNGHGHAAGNGHAGAGSAWPEADLRHRVRRGGAAGRSGRRSTRSPCRASRRCSGARPPPGSRPAPRRAEPSSIPEITSVARDDRPREDPAEGARAGDRSAGGRRPCRGARGSRPRAALVARATTSRHSSGAPEVRRGRHGRRTAEELPSRRRRGRRGRSRTRPPPRSPRRPRRGRRRTRRSPQRQPLAPEPIPSTRSIRRPTSWLPRRPPRPTASSTSSGPSPARRRRPAIRSCRCPADAPGPRARALRRRRRPRRPRPAPAQLPYAAVAPASRSRASPSRSGSSGGRRPRHRPASRTAPRAAMPYAPAPVSPPTPALRPAGRAGLRRAGRADPAVSGADRRPSRPAPAMYPPFQPDYAAAPPQPRTRRRSTQYASPQPQYAPPAAPRAVVADGRPREPVPGPRRRQRPHRHTARPRRAQWPSPSGRRPRRWPAPLARGAEAVWAESTRDLLSRPETGVSACFNCGLPLSATARFCRRCGTNQVAS